MTGKITAESLRKDRERRARERDQLATDYEWCADALDDIRAGRSNKDERRALRAGADLLRSESDRWQR